MRQYFNLITKSKIILLSMKYKALIASCALVVCAVAILPASAETARNVFKTIFARSIVLQGKDSFIQKKGVKPVTIKDNLKVKGNITLREGATVDGKDISELVTIPECSIDSTIIQTDEGWACDDSGDAIGVDYERVITVAQSGGDFATITDALASITDSSFSRSYVVWIAPGFYYESITLPDYVDLQGASRDTVYIYPNDLSTDGAAITSGGHNVVRDLTISAVGSGNITEVHVLPGHTFELDNVVAYISEIVGTEARTVYNDQGYLTVRDSDISAGTSAGESYGIYSTGALTLVDSSVELSDYSTHTNIYGVHIGGSGYTSTIKNSYVKLFGSGSSTGAEECRALYVSGDGLTVDVEGSDFTVELCNSTERAAVAQSNGSSTIKAYDSRFDSSDDHAIDVDQSVFSGASIMASGTGVANSGGVVTCVYSYTDLFSELNASCESGI